MASLREPTWMAKNIWSMRGMLMPRRNITEKAAYNSLHYEIDSCIDSASEGANSPMIEAQISKYDYTKKSTTGKWTKRILIAFLSMWALISSALFLENLPPRDPQSLSCSCGGTTVAEAIRRGCIFTPLAIAWLPPHCIDFDLSDEFDRAGPGPHGEWEYWADPSRKTALTREEVGMLADVDGVFYTTQDWHITHCTYTWRKHFRQNVTGVTIERRSNGLDHIWHCEKVFQIRAGLQEIATVAGIALDADDPGETNFDDFDDLEGL